MIFNFFRAVFRRSPVEAFILFSFVLIVVEKLMELGFVCPCTYSQNITLCMFYALVPGSAASAFTYYALGSEPDHTSGQQRRERIGYSVGSFFLWLALFFLDGQYVACASSDWKGKPSFDLFYWCYPTGPYTLPSGDLKQKTQTYIFASEVTGFVLLTANIVALMCHCRLRDQANTEENVEEP